MKIILTTVKAVSVDREAFTTIIILHIYYMPFYLFTNEYNLL